MQNYWNCHLVCKQQQLYGPVNYRDFRETDPRALSAVMFWTLGSISNDNGDVNENGKKAIGSDGQNNNSARASRFLCAFLCRHCTTTTRKSLISRFVENVNTRQLYFSLREPPEKIANIWQTERDGTSAIKFEAAGLHFSIDVFVAVAVGVVTRDNSQRRFYSAATLLQYCFEWLQHCFNIATLCCAKNRRCKVCSVTSPYAPYCFIKFPVKYPIYSA